MGRAGLALIAVLAIYAIIVPAIGNGPLYQDLPERLSGPGWGRLMGTDQLGRDQFSRVAEAVKNSLVTAVAVVVISGIGGGALGIWSGFLGGKADLLMQRAVDVVMALPLFVVALAVVTAFGASYWTMMLAISIGFMPLTLRVVRSSTLSIRDSEFILASRISGGSNFRTVVRHIAPNVVGPWAVVAASQAGAAVLVEAALAFLGLAPAGRITLGGLLGGQAQTYMYSAPWLVIWPGVGIAALALGFNLLGEWLAERSNRLPGS